jgi:hypothetical protein
LGSASALDSPLRTSWPPTLPLPTQRFAFAILPFLRQQTVFQSDKRRQDELANIEYPQKTKETLLTMN